MWRIIGSGDIWKGEIKNKAKDGSFYWVDTTIVPFLDKTGKPNRYISIRHNITKLKEYEKTIKQMAYNDSLTMLPNRNFLNEWINNQLVGNSGAITVLFIDVDRFKSINDSFGHNVGDIVLKEVAKRLQSCLHSTDVIVRQGGDEFIIFLNGTHNKRDVIKFVNDIFEQFTYPFLVTGETIYTSASIGVSMGILEKNQKDYMQKVEVLIQQADTAMYHAKKQGGHSYCFNTSDQNDEKERLCIIEHEVKRALSQNEFNIVYQPLVNLENDQLAGVEALLRWNNPRIGSIPPAEFIPLLEEVGDIIPVGKWVIKSVCHQMKSWYDKGIQINRAAINVSPIQLRDKDFVKEVKQILLETELEPRYLELEITEGTILHIGKSEKILNELRDIGVRISIDDFGTGYSSLSRLKQLPINTLKIDKSFIDDLDIDGEIIVNTIISMGKNLGFNVVAEGIESEEQLSYLKNVGCHEGQGYYWSVPIGAEEIIQIYQENNTMLAL